MQRSKKNSRFVYRWETKEGGWSARPNRGVPVGTDGLPLHYLTPVRSQKSAKVLTCQRRVLGQDQSRTAQLTLRHYAERSR